MSRSTTSPGRRPDFMDVTLARRCFLRQAGTGRIPTRAPTRAGPEMSERVPPSGSGSDTQRLVAGAVTWALLVLMPSLSVAVLLSMLVFLLFPIAVLTALFYLVLT